jgi:hypothetical protein
MRNAKDTPVKVSPLAGKHATPAMLVDEKFQRVAHPGHQSGYL